MPINSALVAPTDMVRLKAKPKTARMIHTVLHRIVPQSRYSVDRLQAINTYSRSTPWRRKIAVICITPLPASVMCILLNFLFPLASPSQGLAANYGFFIRMFAITVMAVLAAIWQREFFLQIKVSLCQRLLISLGVGVFHTSLYLALPLAFGVFPVPFLPIVAVFVVFPLPFAITVMCRVLKRRRTQSISDFKTTVTKYRRFLLFEGSLLAIYTAFTLGFKNTRKWWQTMYVCLLPILKYVLTQVAKRQVAHLEDVSAESVVFSVELFNSMYSSMCICNATNLRTSGLLMIVDFVHMAWSLYRISFRTTNVVNTLERLLQQDLQHHGSLTTGSGVATKILASATGRKPSDEQASRKVSDERASRMASNDRFSSTRYESSRIASERLTRQHATPKEEIQDVLDYCVAFAREHREAIRKYTDIRVDASNGLHFRKESVWKAFSINSIMSERDTGTFVSPGASFHLPQPLRESQDASMHKPRLSCISEDQAHTTRDLTKLTDGSQPPRSTHVALRRLSIRSEDQVLTLQRLSSGENRGSQKLFQHVLKIAEDQVASFQQMSDETENEDVYDTLVELSVMAKRQLDTLRQLSAITNGETNQEQAPNEEILVRKLLSEAHMHAMAVRRLLDVAEGQSMPTLSNTAALNKVFEDQLVSIRSGSRSPDTASSVMDSLEKASEMDQARTSSAKSTDPRMVSLGRSPASDGVSTSSGRITDNPMVSLGGIATVEETRTTSIKRTEHQMKSLDITPTTDVARTSSGRFTDDRKLSSLGGVPTKDVARTSLIKSKDDRMMSLGRSPTSLGQTHATDALISGDPTGAQPHQVQPAAQNASGPFEGLIVDNYAMLPLAPMTTDFKLSELVVHANDKTKTQWLSHNRKELEFLREVLILLHLTERVVLVEYVEAFVPIFYALYLFMTYHSPNKNNFYGIKDLEEHHMIQAVGNTVMYAVLESLSLLILSVIVRRRFGLNVFNLLAFVLETHFFNVQAKLWTFFIIILNLMLVHCGVDLTLEFKDRIHV